MFYGRKKELSLLEERYDHNGFEFLPVYGRRRVGKTSLLKEFSKGKNHVFFTASEGTLEYNLSRLASKILDANVEASIETVMDIIRKRAEKERFLLIIDEYPRLIKRSTLFQDKLQELIDEIHEESKLFLILCGSSISIMEHEVLGYKSPLYGRRTGSMELNPLNLWESLDILSGFDRGTALRIYGMVGGIPLYLLQFRPSETLERNLEISFLRQDSFFINEHLMTLIEEFENPATYYSVLTAVASGRSKASEISDYTKLDVPTTTKFLANLESIRMVTKDRPVDNPDGKMTRYSISDPFMRFQFGRVLPTLESGSDMEDMVTEILRLHETDMGLVFEDMCTEYLISRFGGRIGRWWGSDPVTKKQEEIDIVLTSMSGGRRSGLFVECKYRNEKVGQDILDTLMHRASLVKGYDERRYALFSKSGFKDGMDDRSDVDLYTLDDVLKEPKRASKSDCDSF